MDGREERRGMGERKREGRRRMHVSGQKQVTHFIITKPSLKHKYTITLSWWMNLPTFHRCLVAEVLLIVLENVEHCGGEPEQADTGIPLYAVP